MITESPRISKAVFVDFQPKIVMKNHRAFKRLFPDTGIDWYVIHSLGKQ